MFKYKIKIILKSGYEIRVRAKDYRITGMPGLEMVDYKPDYWIQPLEIAAVIVKHWYQCWE